MTALALQLNMLEPLSGMAQGMMPMLEGYWMLEAVKLAAVTVLLGWCYRTLVSCLTPILITCIKAPHLAKELFIWESRH
jgi:hypothetical protein